MDLDEYLGLDALALAARVADGGCDAHALLDLALDRLAAVEPALRAIAVLDEGVARRRIDAGLPDGPLTGVPFLLKDLGAEAADLPSSGGSALLRGTRHPRDSTLVARLDATGLVRFGRTTAPEGGVGPVTEARVYGAPTRNPWDLGRTPGGSSGGAAAVVAAGAVPAAHGSDGGGSVRIPASCCGLVGFKPTRARLPDGPYAGEGWAGMATDGFLTRTVRDSAALLDAVAGADLGAPYRAPPMPTTFAGALDARLPRLRVAVCDTALDGAPIDADVRAGVNATADLLDSLGHRVERARPGADVGRMMRAWTTIVACGTAEWIDAALARRGGELGPDDVEPVARSAHEHARALSGTDYLRAVEAVHAYGREMAAFFDPEGARVARTSPGAPRRGPKEDLGDRTRGGMGRRRIGRNLSRPIEGSPARLFAGAPAAGKGFDVLLTATLAEPPARIGRFDHSRPDYVDYRTGPDGVFAYSPFTAAFNASGQPAVSLPLHVGTAGEARGLPIGIHFAAPFGEDALLIALAAELEAARPWAQRRPSCNFDAMATPHDTRPSG